jgi:hypothetical protein
MVSSHGRASPGPQARHNYQVVLKDDGLEIEIGSIGVHAAEYWAWGIVIPKRDVDTLGTGKDRKHSMKQFRAAWDKFSCRSRSVD